MSGGLRYRDRAVTARLRDAPRELTLELRARYRDAARDAARRAQDAIRRADSRHPGQLRERIAATVVVSLAQTADGVTAKITSNGRKMPAGQETLPGYANGGSARWLRWRHPVFGREDEPWVSQDWPSARGWFDRTLGDQRGRLATAAREAVDAAAAKLGVGE